MRLCEIPTLGMRTCVVYFFSNNGERRATVTPAGGLAVNGRVVHANMYTYSTQSTDAPNVLHNSGHSSRSGNMKERH